MVHGYIKQNKKMLLLWGKPEHIKPEIINNNLILV